MGTRIVVALLVAVALIASGVWFAIRTRRKFEKSMRSDDLRTMQADGTFPPELRDLNLDIIPLSGFGMNVSPRDLRRVWIADLLQSLWWIWIPTVIGICLLIALTVGKSSSGT